MLLEDNSAAIREKRDGRRRRPYRTQVAGVLAAAFSLSLAYSVIVTFTGSHEGYGMADPALWAFYAVGFGLVALVLSDRTWAWWVVVVVVLALIGVGIFYYPTVFPRARRPPSPGSRTTSTWGFWSSPSTSASSACATSS